VCGGSGSMPLPGVGDLFLSGPFFFGRWSWTLPALFPFFFPIFSCHQEVGGTPLSFFHGLWAWRLVCVVPCADDEPTWWHPSTLVLSRCGCARRDTGWCFGRCDRSVRVGACSEGGGGAGGHGRAPGRRHQGLEKSGHRGVTKKLPLWCFCRKVCARGDVAFSRAVRGVYFGSWGERKGILSVWPT